MFVYRTVSKMKIRSSVSELQNKQTGVFKHMLIQNEAKGRVLMHLRPICETNPAHIKDVFNLSYVRQEPLLFFYPYNLMFHRKLM